MAAYDLEALSPQEFEELVGDLLHSETGRRFELFIPGRDGGIDLRNCLKNETIIVQCKHFFKSNFKRLETELKNEKDKVETLKPTQYIVVTSCGLTPGNKKKIFDIFSPYCLSQSDIYGRNDVLNLLKNHEDVAQKNYKLWYTSDAVLSKILHNRILNQTDTDLENFKEILPKLVTNDAYLRVKEALKNVNSCVICGPPGIGKSTLMKLFVWHYASQGYQPIKIYKNINEVYELFDKDQKRIYYYDDFLGDTVLNQGLGKNEDSEICSFIQRINKMSNKKFILTTREHILNQALSHSEKLLKLKKYESIISLSDFTLMAKARILYNYLWHSKISEKNIREILENKNYMKIVQHPSFNPRIIQMMTDEDKVLNKDYLEHFLNALNHPDELWSHAFEDQISPPAQTILLTLGTFGYGVTYDDLWLGFYHYYSVSTLNEVELSRSFDKGLKELDGSFIKIDFYGDKRYFRFGNPSIRDFINNYMLKNKVLTNTLCKKATFYSQLKQLWNILQNGCQREGKKVTEYISLSIYLDSMERLFHEDGTSDSHTPYDEKIYHLLNVTTIIKDKTYIKFLQDNLKFLIQQNYRGETEQLELLYTILILIKNSKDFFSYEISTDFEELVKSSKIALLSKQPTFISEFILIKKYIDNLGVTLEEKEMNLLKYRLNMILSEGIEIDTSEKEFVISTFNPDDNSFESTGFGINGLESLKNELEEISPIFESSVNKPLKFVQQKIDDYYESIDNSDNSEDTTPEIPNKQENQSLQIESEIDMMFETLKHK